MSGHTLSVLEHVLDLGRGVKGERREALVQLPHDRQRVASTVEEVRVTERDVSSAHVHQALDVAQHRVGLHDSYASVVDRRDRAVPAAVHAAVAGLHVADQALLTADRQARVMLQSGQELSRRRVKGPPGELDDRRLRSLGQGFGVGQAVDPGHQRRLIFAGDHAVREFADHQFATHRCVQAIETDR